MQHEFKILSQTKAHLIEEDQFATANISVCMENGFPTVKMVLSSAYNSAYMNFSAYPTNEVTQRTIEQITNTAEFIAEMGHSIEAASVSFLEASKQMLESIVVDNLKEIQQESSNQNLFTDLIMTCKEKSYNNYIKFCENTSQTSKSFEDLLDLSQRD